MQDELKIAMCQMDLAWEDKAQNLTKVSQFFDELPLDTDLWILPEMFTTGFTNNASRLGESMEGTTIDLLKQWASLKDVAIAASLIIKNNEAYFNRFVFVKPNGTVHTYDKAHLFPFGEEDRFYKKGTERVIIEYKGWRIMPQVCYDLRFPVWSRNDLDYDLCIYVASWPAARNHVWRTLLMARAIENMCYTIGVNRVGRDGNNIDYSGQSLASNAKGELLNTLSDKEQQDIIQIQRETLHQFRAKFPVLKNQDTFEITSL